MAASDALGPQWVRADEVQVGDRTSSNGKTRVTKVHIRNGEALHALKTTGSRSPSIQKHPVDKPVRVWRKKA